jgi:hypothetical protein
MNSNPGFCGLIDSVTVATAGIWLGGQSGTPMCASASFTWFNPQQGKPLYFWTYAQGAMNILCMNIGTIYKNVHFICLMDGSLNIESALLFVSGS